MVAAGWLVTGALLLLVSMRLRNRPAERQVPLLGVVSALMLIAMSTEIVPIAYHINLSVLAGIILGPTLGVVAAVIVNTILALFGHGGITVAGLNSLVLATEVAAGYYFYRGVLLLLGGRQASPALSAGIATALALFVGTVLMIGIVVLSEAGVSEQASRTVQETLSFANPFERGLVSTALLGPEEHEVAEGGSSLDPMTFARLVLILGAIGWTLEAILTAAIVSFVSRVRPDLVSRRAEARWT